MNNLVVSVWIFSLCLAINICIELIKYTVWRFWDIQSIHLNFIGQGLLSVSLNSLSSVLKQCLADKPSINVCWIRDWISLQLAFFVFSSRFWRSFHVNLFKDRIVFYSMDVPELILPPPPHGYNSSCFQFSTTISNAAGNVHINDCLCTCARASARWPSWSVTSESEGMHILTSCG